MPKKKPFIDKAHATTYHVVHRSQRDPELANPDASDRVLLPVSGKGAELFHKTSDDSADVRLDDYEYGEFGFPNDGYDYSQHLKPMGQPGAVFLAAPAEKPKVKFAELPPEVLPSKKMNEVGMLDLGISRGLDLSVDPDIAAALDDSDAETGEFDELEDDFIALANEEGEEKAHDNENGEAHHGFGPAFKQTKDSGSSGSSDEKGGPRIQIGAKSVASTLFARGGVPTIIDDKLDVLIEGYEDGDIGEGEDETQGRDIDEMDDVLNEYYEKFEPLPIPDDKDVRLRAKQMAAEEGEEKETVTVFEDMTRDGTRERWDCQSILTSLSTTDNLPGIIGSKGRERRRKPKKILEEKEEEEEEEDELVNKGNRRPKKESAEEKKRRKQVVKAERRTRRVEKRSTKIEFKQEEVRQKELKDNTAGVSVVKY